MYIAGGIECLAGTRPKELRSLSISFVPLSVVLNMAGGMDRLLLGMWDVVAALDCARAGTIW